MPQTSSWIELARGSSRLAVIAFAMAGGAAAQSVSYSREVAPVLAMNCHSCHGANPESVAGGLSTRTWADLKKGGNLGPVIVPGDPERSALLQFVNGDRGEAHRMPLGGPPLTAMQISWIQRWIAEGAAEDSDGAAKYRLELPSITFDGAMPLRFFCKIPTAGYVELEIADAGGRVLYLDGIAVKAVRDVAALATPDEWIIWNLRRASDWPSEVRARLTVSYTTSEPAPAVFAVTSENTGSSLKWPAAGQVAVSVVSTPGGQSVFQGREQMPGGMPSLERWAARLDPGLYVLRLHCDRDSSEMAILLRAPARAP